MQAYRFSAFEANGAMRKGVMQADSARAARVQLRAQGLTPLQVTPIAREEGGAAIWAASWFARGASRRVMGQAELLFWTRQMADLVSASFPLELALAATMEPLGASHARRSSKVERRSALIASLRAEVHAGASFAAALAQHPHEFDSTYCAVVAAGELSGDLGSVLVRMADELQAQQALRSKVLGAALYPLIVTCIAFVMVFFLMTYVVPQVTQVFVGSRQALPLLTTVMLGLSAHAQRYWWLWMLCSMALYGGLRLALRVPRFRLQFDSWWLGLPVVGALAQGYNAARFSGTLAMLMAAGAPILRGLQAATQTLSNQAMQEQAVEMGDAVREGASLGSVMQRCEKFPQLLALFAQLGEQTGELPQMLQRASAQLSAEVQRRALVLTTVLEPLLIVTMGVVVLLIVLSVLLPIIEMNALIR